MSRDASGEMSMKINHDRLDTRWLYSLAVALVMLTGCGRPINVAALGPADIVRMQATADQADRSYFITAGDTIHIRYPFHPEMDQEALVQPDGKIMASGIGSFAVAGLSTAQVEQLLKEKTSSRLRNPEIVVTIRRFTDRAVYVGGEVGGPGTQLYRRGLTPLQAVIAAGGFRETARVTA